MRTTHEATETITGLLKKIQTKRFGTSTESIEFMKNPKLRKSLLVFSRRFRLNGAPNQQPGGPDTADPSTQNPRLLMRTSPEAKEIITGLLKKIQTKRFGTSTESIEFMKHPVTGCASQSRREVKSHRKFSSAKSTTRGSRHSRPIDSESKALGENDSRS